MAAVDRAVAEAEELAEGAGGGAAQASDRDLRSGRRRMIDYQRAGRAGVKANLLHRRSIREFDLGCVADRDYAGAVDGVGEVGSAVIADVDYGLTAVVRQRAAHQQESV